MPGKTRSRHGSRRSTANALGRRLVPGGDDRRVVADGRGRVQELVPHRRARLVVEVPAPPALGDARVVAVGPVAARDVGAVLQVRRAWSVSARSRSSRRARCRPTPTAGAGSATGAGPDDRRWRRSTTRSGGPCRRTRARRPRARTWRENVHSGRVRGGVAARLERSADGRRVLVVGAGTRPSDDPDAPIGNGRAISVLRAAEGAAVACADLDRDAATETARLVGAEAGRGGGHRRRRHRRGRLRADGRRGDVRRSAGSTGSCATSASASAAVSRARRSTSGTRCTR